MDAGHGGYDIGAKNSSNIFEKNVTLKIALKVGALLERDGIKVLYTRTTDEVSWTSDNKLDLRARVKVLKLMFKYNKGDKNYEKKEE
ncbi:N-acetylmuramoyl-L-alanine amidase [Clostridium sp. CF012]|uniref:N-acetylmuramoyl-L-alanine amidase family protein n=1 Tax=Clostridium sp. CF012 TaxID=2843319 RepID=UPI0028162139|nr:N-acetylmuramoyl-L-alanine amidase [Clostridium sp. CF012]